MKDSHYRISLDIHSTQSQVSLPVKQGDTSRKVFISLCEGGKPYQIEKDCFAVFSAKKPDNEEILDDCIIADNVIEYTFTEQTTAASGMLDCEILLYGVDRGLITSPHFTIIVDARVVGDTKVKSSTEYSALDKLCKDTMVLKDAMEDLQTEVETKLANGEFDGEDVNYNLVSNALKGTASGTTIRLDDVSPVEHTAKVRVHGKNLIPYSYENSNFSRNGVTFVENGDGSITLTGSPTADAEFIFTSDIPLTQGTYTYSVKGNLPASVIGNIALRSRTTNAWIKNIVSVNATTPSVVFTLTEELLHGNKVSANIFVLGGKGETNITIYPQLEIGTTETAYVPPLDPTTVTLTRYGASETDNLQTYTPERDGTVSVTSLYPTTTLFTDKADVTIDVEYNKDANKVIAELIDLIGTAGNFVTDVTILANKWVGTSSPYSQVVAVEGATKKSQVDLTPSAEQLAIFHNKDLAFVTENDNGVITVYAIGQKPTNDYTIQATVTEVKV